MSIDKLRVYSGKPLIIDSEHEIKVYQPSVDEIVDIGEKQFNELVLPFILTTEAIFNGIENEDELVEKYNVFDLFFIQSENGKTILDDTIFSGKKALDVLIDAIVFFTHVDKSEIRVINHLRNSIAIGRLVITRENFSLLKDAIHAVLNRKDIEIEKPPKDMGSRQKAIWEKLQQGRRRRAEKEASYLQDIMNFVQFGGNSYIPIQEILSMTYYQLYNAYKSILGKEAHHIGTLYKISPKFEIKDEISHWTKTIKIGN